MTDDQLRRYVRACRHDGRPESLRLAARAVWRLATRLSSQR